MFYGRNWSN